MKRRKIAVVVLVVMMLTVFAAGCGNSQQDSDGKTENADKAKVGFIFIGAPGDAGWTYSHDQARQYLESQVPEVTTTYRENVPEGADAEANINQLVQEGCKVIFANSFGYGDAVLEVAAKHPEVVFMHASGVKTEENVGTFFGRIYQPRYLSGMIAGKMTQSNTLGYVAAYPIPEVVRGINAFTLGAQAVNPDVKVKVVWTTTWFDPTKEKEAAKTLIEQGCDVIAQHQDTYAPQQAAQEAGVYSIGYHSDMSKFAPDACLTSVVWNWNEYYVKTVKSVLDGTWKNEPYWGGMEDGIVGLAPISDKVPADVKQMVKDKEQAIKDGSFKIFAGPIKAQDGTLKVPEGKVMTDEEMLNFDWFVAGVEGQLNK
ncbi:MAG: BMP family ABC transporter substrate-binding protein [Syntrophomonadaceae bacterium]|nr:BMP family ABC transporter substrate-binding protein [Syntrophomonadaceae bacterium]MDD3889518.1 BMP family ABC transporter substrate-binding protein [Syntrophomonadaceae bacterium]